MNGKIFPSSIYSARDYPVPGVKCGICMYTRSTVARASPAAAITLRPYRRWVLAKQTLFREQIV
jgi:hypothetical protein